MTAAPPVQPSLGDRVGWLAIALGLGLVLCDPGWAQDPEAARDGESLVMQAERLLEAGEIRDAKQVLGDAFRHPEEHAAAYARLVLLGIAERDSETLQALFSQHRAFPFEDPENFRRRVSAYESRPLRRQYNQAIQATLSRRWDDAERGFAVLLGDGMFHVAASGWLFRVAMQQRDFERARFVAELARNPPDDPGASADVLAACALQRVDDRQAALGYLIRELARRGAYDAPRESRVSEQRAVYLAMLRLHNELDQCFLRSMRNVDEARPLFPDLDARVLEYLARRAPPAAH